MAPSHRVTSRQHPFVRRCRALASRRREDAVLLDGDHLVRDALRAGVPLDGILADDRPRPWLADIQNRGDVPVYDGSAAAVAAASPVETPSGVVAIARWSPAALDTLFAPEAPLVVGLVDVQDPGNLGAAIRSAEALGASGVAALGTSADPGGWKALRGSMGSTFRLPVARGATADALARARARGVRTAALVARGGAALEAAALAAPLLVLAGNEGAGLPDDVLAAVDERVTIPMRPGVESLNVAVTVALLLWEANRRSRPQAWPA